MLGRESVGRDDKEPDSALGRDYDEDAEDNEDNESAQSGNDDDDESDGIVPAVKPSHPAGNIISCQFSKVIQGLKQKVGYCASYRVYG